MPCSCTYCATPIIPSFNPTSISCKGCGCIICEICAATKTWTCPDCSRKYCIGCEARSKVVCNECDHIGCKRCLTQCGTRGVYMCTDHHVDCAHCGRSVYPNCIQTCDNCDSEICENCLRTCDECSTSGCSDCIRTCSSSGNYYCSDCGFTCERCDSFYRYALRSSCEDRVLCEACLEAVREEQERNATRLERDANSRKYLNEDSENDLKGSFDVSPLVRPKDYDTTRIPWDSLALLNTLSYSTTPSNWNFKRKLWEPQNALYLGMEWELNFPSEKEAAIKKTVEHYLSQRYIWKRDGSIYSGGAELVLTPMTLQAFREVNLKELCNCLKLSGATGYDYGECGIHVHASMDQASPKTIRKVMAWFMVNRKFVRRFSKRTISSINHWAKIPYNLKIWFEGYTDDVSSSYNRHIAINRTDKTWEFRVFRSTTRYERIKAILHFVTAIIDFAKLHSFAVCASSNGFNFFMRWLAKNQEHDFLSNYLAYEPGLYKTEVITAKDVNYRITDDDFQPELSC